MAVAAIIAVIATPTAMAIEEPRFEVLEKDGSFELRESDASRVGATRRGCVLSSAIRQANDRTIWHIGAAGLANGVFTTSPPLKPELVISCDA